MCRKFDHMVKGTLGRNIVGRGSPSLVGFRAHNELDVDTIFNLVPCKVRLFIRFPIHVHLIYIYSLLAPPLRGYVDILTIAHLHADSRQGRRPYVVYIARRSDGIKAHTVEDVPGRHLPTVVVSTQRTRLIAIEAVYNLAHQLLALP